MKMKHLILAAGITLFATACESTRQTTGSNTSTDGTSSSMTQPQAGAMPTTSGNVNSTSGTNNSSGTNSSTSPASTNPASSGNTNNTSSTFPASTSQTTSGNMNSAPGTNPSGNAVTVSGNTMANSTMNSTTRSDTSITPPGTVQSSFSTKYPQASNVRWYQYNQANVPIDWELTGRPALTNRDYSVTYDVDNATHNAWYDAQGNWVGSTSQMKDYKGLPSAITSMLSSKYAGYNITDVHAETYKDRSGYQIEMSKGTDKVKMVVDANGNILKQKTKTVDANGNEVKEKTKIDN